MRLKTQRTQRAAHTDTQTKRRDRSGGCFLLRQSVNALILLRIQVRQRDAGLGWPNCNRAVKRGARTPRAGKPYRRLADAILLVLTTHNSK